MNHSSREAESVAPPLAALQQAGGEPHAPRPLPLFLELVRQMASSDPTLARRALAGLDAYAAAPRGEARPLRQPVATAGGASLRDHGGSGPLLILVPSLINPPDILDLDRDTSLAEAMTATNQVLLLDWGKAAERSRLDVTGHVEELLLPLLDEVGERPMLAGYCLGGTMALAAADAVEVKAVATLAAPWHFSAYEGDSRKTLGSIWTQAQTASSGLGALPMEVLQAAFWALDPARTVTKFAQFGQLDPTCDDARRFVVLEDWANQGEPLPFPAAKELFEQLFDADLSGNGRWRVGGRYVAEQPSCPTLHCVARDDRIVPASSAPCGRRVELPAGHVGMIVGGRRGRLHDALRGFFAP